MNTLVRKGQTVVGHSTDCVAFRQIAADTFAQSGVFHVLGAGGSAAAALAALSDDVEATVDYGSVVRRVVALATEQRVRLIERLAGLLSEAMLREFPAREVTVRVRKLTPPLDGIAAVPGVQMKRSR